MQSMLAAILQRLIFLTKQQIDLMKNLLSFIVIISILISCSKDANYEADIVKPKIQVAYPVDNPVMRSGDPLCIKVLISDNKSLMNVWLQVSDGNGFKKDYAITGRSMDIIEKYIIPAGINGNFVAKYSAMDEAGNLNSEEIKFTVNN
jgi:hypothetical protein